MNDHPKGCHCLDCTGIILEPWDQSDEDAYQRIIHHSGWFAFRQKPPPLDRGGPSNA